MQHPETECLHGLVDQWDAAVTACTADPDDPDASEHLAQIRNQIIAEVWGIHPPLELAITQAHETLNRAQETLDRAWNHLP